MVSFILYLCIYTNVNLGQKCIFKFLNNAVHIEAAIIFTNFVNWHVSDLNNSNETLGVEISLINSVFDGVLNYSIFPATDF